MLEVHAILQRQRCNENITKKTGTLSDAYEFYANVWYVDLASPAFALDPKSETHKVRAVIAF